MTAADRQLADGGRRRDVSACCWFSSMDPALLRCRSLASLLVLLCHPSHDHGQCMGDLFLVLSFDLIGRLPS
jgi:hypothetical protein